MKNDQDERRKKFTGTGTGKNQSQETVGGVEKEFSTDFIRHTIRGRYEEYRGEQTTIKWPVPLENGKNE